MSIISSIFIGIIISVILFVIWLYWSISIYRWDQDRIIGIAVKKYLQTRTDNTNIYPYVISNKQIDKNKQKVSFTIEIIYSGLPSSPTRQSTKRDVFMSYVISDNDRCEIYDEKCFIV